jgi:acyl-CoA synthetase (AMP-forming)/AMP-acid ligase II
MSAVNRRNIRSVIYDYYIGARPTFQRGFFNATTNDYDFIKIYDFSKLSFLVGCKMGSQIDSTVKTALIVCSTPFATLLGFYGAITLNLIPLIVPIKRNIGVESNAVDTLQNLHEILGNDVIIISDEGYSIQEVGHYKNMVCSYRLPTSISKATELLKEEFVPEFSQEPNGVAFMQMTSGSTGHSKLIVVSNENLWNNVDAIFQETKCSEEVGVSWLPLHHDMGLVGAELFCLIKGIPLHLMSPFDFLKRPSRWLETISKYHCTLSPAPNFAYDYCVEMIGEMAPEVDLSTWRVAFNGAEPIHAKTLCSFISKFGKWGFRPNAFLTCYGQAENTLAVTFPDVNTPVGYLELNSNHFVSGEVITILGSGYIDSHFVYHKDKIYSISVGKPPANTKITIVGKHGDVLPDETIGEIVVEGSCIALGYYVKGNNEMELLQGRNFSGDIGFIWQGNLYIIDRIKNIVIRNGENYSSSLLEKKLGDILGILSTNIAVFQNDILSKNHIAAIVEIPRGSDLTEIIRKWEMQSSLPIDLLYFSKRKCIPKTPGGKIQHMLCREILLKDDIKNDLFCYSQKS